MECTFCQKTFVSKWSLKTHISTNKTCLKIQGKEPLKSYNCEYCEKIFTHLDVYSKHQNVCKLKKKEDEKNIDEIIEKNLKLENENMSKDLYIKELKEMIVNLQKTIKEMADKPNIINTKNVINMKYSVNLKDIDNIKKIFEERMKPEHIIDGQVGIAKLLLEEGSLLKKDGKYLYKVTDPSRNIFEFTNEYGTIEKDINAFKLTEAISKSIPKSLVVDNFNKLCTTDGKFDDEKYMYYNKDLSNIINIGNDNITIITILKKITI